MKILLHVFSRSRDAAMMRVLAELLRRRGHRVALASSPSIGFLIRFWRPDLLFLTNPDTLDGFVEQGLVSPNSGPLVGMFPQEGMNFADRDKERWYGRFRNPDYAAMIDRIFLWNSHEYDWLIANTALEPEQVMVAGGARMDIVRYSDSVRKPNTPLNIGFISRFVLTNRADGIRLEEKFVDAAGVPGSPEVEDAIELIESEYRTLACYSYLIERLSAETDYRFSLRGHHEESASGPIYRRFSARYGDRIEIDHSESLYHWALRMDAIVTTNSTSIAEINMAGTPTINVDNLTRVSDMVSQGPLADTNEPMLLSCYSGITMPNTVEELMNAIAAVTTDYTLPPNEPLEELLRTGYSWPMARSGIGLIAESIDRSARSGRCSRRRNGTARLPKAAGDLYYFVNLVRGRFGTTDGARGRYFNRFLHRGPDYISGIVDNIEKEIRELGKDIPADNRLNPVETVSEEDGLRSAAS